MKRYLTILLTVVLLILALSTQVFAAEASGTCGENLTWTLNEEGTLTISGEGAMKDFSVAVRPAWYGQRTSIQKVVIEEGVKNIGSYAFEECVNLTDITVPDSVTGIGTYAFSKCRNLTGITVPEHMDTIGAYAFYDCTNLEQVYMTDLANWCAIRFANAYANPMCYAEAVYVNGQLLKTLVIPEGVTEIGPYAFYGCTGLTRVTFSDRVTDIGAYSFFNCENLKKVTLSDSVTYIGTAAFGNCGVKEVYIADLSKWCKIEFGSYASNPLHLAGKLYVNGKLVTDLVIPEGVDSIGTWAFRNCRSLTSVTIADTVTKIGDGAFFDCKGLTGITISDSVTDIGQIAFRNCTSMTTVTFNGEAPVIAANAFQSVTASAFYPEEKTTWTEGVRQNYGGILNWSSYKSVIPGDLDDNGSVDDEDVIYLLWHTLMQDEYPVNQDVDFDHNGSVDDEDVIYLLWHTLMPSEYPL